MLRLHFSDNDFVTGRVVLVILVVFLCRISIQVGLDHTAHAAPYLYYDPFPVWENVFEEACEIGDMTFELDSNGAAHLFFSRKTEHGEDLLYTHNQAGTFDSPVTLLCVETGFWDLRSGIDSNDALHLIWQDPLPSQQTPLTNIHYAEISAGVIVRYEIVYDGGNARFPDLVIDDAGEIHISFEIQEVGDRIKDYLAYIRSNGGKFQPPETTFFDPEITAQKRWPRICVDHSNTVYFLGGGYYPLILKYIDGTFTEAIEVGEISSIAEGVHELIWGDDDRVHVFYQSRKNRLIHAVSNDGITFNRFDEITTEHFPQYYVTKPTVRSDESCFLMHYQITQLSRPADITCPTLFPSRSN